MITEYPLTKANRLQLAKAFRDVPRMDLSIECVIEGQMGKAFVDDVQAPSAYRIQTGPFSYFAGHAFSEGGREMIRDLRPWTFLMPSAEGWLQSAQSLFGERLIAFDRCSFSSECLSLEHLEGLARQSRFSKDVKQMDIALAAQVWGQDHFVDISEFESPSDFLRRGVGYYAERNGKVIGAAYSSLVCSTAIEVSLFVSDDYRRQGLGTTLSAHLLKWCLEHGMEPHWDAANSESCRLAEKLGYISKGTYQAYYLES